MTITILLLLLYRSLTVERCPTLGAPFMSREHTSTRPELPRAHTIHLLTWLFSPPTLYGASQADTRTFCPAKTYFSLRCFAFACSGNRPARSCACSAQLLHSVGAARAFLLKLSLLPCWEASLPLSHTRYKYPDNGRLFNRRKRRVDILARSYSRCHWRLLVLSSSVSLWCCTRGG